MFALSKTLFFDVCCIYVVYDKLFGGIPVVMLLIGPAFLAIADRQYTIHHFISPGT